MADVLLRNVVKRYGNYEAVRGISLEIPDSKFVALVGPSGCGKTTVLKILAGLHEHSQGDVSIGSAESPFSPGRDVGMVFQQALLLKWRTILANVLLPAEILGLPRAESAERARDLLAMVGLQGFEARFPYELSGGMQQRAAIARALVHNPKLLLMDEPFGALDALTRGVIQDELLKICAATRQTVFMITHDVDEAILLSDKIVLMSNGPRARVAEVVVNTLPKRRQRDTIHHDPQFYRIRNHLVDFLVRRSRLLQAGQAESDSGGPCFVSPGLESETPAPAGVVDGGRRA
jgi:nitrate/nitrite transport system ATP-binding protein